MDHTVYSKFPPPARSSAQLFKTRAGWRSPPPSNPCTRLMDRRNDDPPQSSLPRSLIPHLYTRPHHPDSFSPSPFPPALPSPFPTSRTPAGLPSVRPSLSLPPVGSSLPPLTDPRSEPLRRLEPRPSEPPSNLRTLSPGGVSTSGLLRPMGNLSLPSYPHQHVTPIYSDHAIRPDSNIHAVNTPYSLHAPLPILPRASWQEGEAGPSSLIHSERNPRRGSSQPTNTRHLHSSVRDGQQSEDETRAYHRPRLESYPEARQHPTSCAHHSRELLLMASYYF